LPFTDNAVKQTKTIYFEFGHYAIPASELDGLGDFMRGIDPSKLIHVQIEGHTDSKGSATYNNGLSVKRAKSIRDYFVGHGIPASKISIEGFGEGLPLEPNNTEANRARNRRAVIIPFTGF
jgi:outer membrane protein OmpA-like peptidoglycan-associated protein